MERAQVTGMEGSKIRIVMAGYDRTVPACRVMPYKDDRFIIDEKIEDEKLENDEHIHNHEENLPDQEYLPDESNPIEPIETIVDALGDEDEALNKEVRPKLHSKIAFKVICDEEWKTGNVSAAGKKEGQQKFMCWIRNKNEVENYDFVKDISHWKYCKVEFAI